MVAVVCVLGACDCGGGGLGGGGGASCETTAECGVGLTCVDGRCAPSDPVDAGPLSDAGPLPDAGPPPGECRVPPSASPFESPLLELHWRGDGLPFPTHEQAIVSPVVVDFVEDGPDDRIPEIVFVSYRRFQDPGVLRVVHGRPPHETLMTLAGDGTGPVVDDAAATPSLRFDSHAAAGDLDGDGRAEIVAVLHAGGAVAFRADGSELWRASFPQAEYGANAAVSIADVDADGNPDVVIGRMLLDGQTGAVRWTGAGGRGTNGQGPLSCVADLDEDGVMEIIAGKTVYDALGAIVWEAPSGTGDGFCAVADVLDAGGAAGRDGIPEVVRVANGTLYLHDGPSGEVRWQRALVSCGSGSGRGGAPTVADFDGDGLAEIGVAGSFCYQVFDPACADPLPAECERPGILWTQAAEDDSSNVTSSTVFDFNGDGRAEVIYNDEQHFMVLDGATGEIVFRDENPSRTRTEQPIVADVDNDGNAEIVFTASNEASFAGDRIGAAERLPGVQIWSSADDSWVGARPIWNQHTYHIDNVDSTGTIPTPEAHSWLGHDTYRANAPIDDALAAPNLTITAGSFDTSRCGEGVLVVCADVTNRGDVRVGPGIAVAFYDGDPAAGGMPIGTGTTARALDPGATERVCVDWTPAPTEPRRVWARVDPDGAVRECIEDDNLADLGEGLCAPFG